MTRQRQFLNIIACLIGLSALGWITPGYGQTQVNNIVSGNALDFDGTRDFVDTKAYISGSYTKEAWVFLRDDQQFNNVISGDSLGANTAFWIPNLNGSRLAAGQNSNFRYVEDPNKFPLNKWVHVAVTYDVATRTMTLYKNGIQVAQNKNLRTTDAYNTEGDSLYIGSFSKFVPGENPTFNGKIDEVRIWNKARTAAGIKDSLRTLLTGDEPGLIAYYDFNQGTAGADNTMPDSVNSLIDRSVPDTETGRLRNFALTGTTSNWVASDVGNADIITPSGYTVKIGQAYVSPANQAAISFTFAGAEVGTTYNYSFTDTAKVATPVTGTGTIATATDEITGIDLSSLKDGPITLAVTLTNAEGNTGPQATAKVTKDTAPPTVAISSTMGSITNQNPFPVTITFNERVSGFAAADLMLTNATVDTMQTTADSTVFTASLIPDAPGDVTVNVAADVATDLAGNANTAAAQAFTITYDPNALTVSLSAGPDTLVNENPFTLTVAFNEAVQGFELADIAVTGGTASDLQPVANSDTSYTVAIAPAAEGPITINVAANAVTTTSGKSNQAAPTLMVTYDATAPTVTLAAAAAQNDSIPVTITFSERVSGFAAADLTLTSVTAGKVQTTDSTVFTVNVVPAAEGESNMTIAENTVTDLAGNANTAATPLVFSGTGGGGGGGDAPSVALSSSVTGATSKAPIPATITFSEKVNGFDSMDVTIENGTLATLTTEDSTTFTAGITPTADGTLKVTVADSVAMNAGGVPNTPSDTLTLLYDTTAPTVTLTTQEPDTTKASPFAVTITFSEKVSGFAAADLAPTNATVSDLQSADSITFTANVTPTPDTTVTVTLNLAADAVGDAAGNGNTAAAPLSLVYNGAPPVTGIEEISILYRLDIYPVPASQYLKVDGYLEQSAVVSYQLSSQSGKLFKQKRLGKVNSIKETLSLDNVGAGLYLFTLYVDGKPVTSKIIITK